MLLPPDACSLQDILYHEDEAPGEGATQQGRGERRLLVPVVLIQTIVQIDNNLKVLAI
jgi:hypothetical protein